MKKGRELLYYVKQDMRLKMRYPMKKRFAWRENGCIFEKINLTKNVKKRKIVLLAFNIDLTCPG